MGNDQGDSKLLQAIANFVRLRCPQVNELVTFMYEGQPEQGRVSEIDGEGTFDITFRESPSCSWVVARKTADEGFTWIRGSNPEEILAMRAAYALHES
jgi:hypothetical protein